MINFKMIGINVAQFAILTQDIPAQGDAVSIKADLQFSVTHDVRLIEVKARFIYVHNDAQLLVLEVHCRFEVEKKNREQLISKDAIIIPKDFLAHLAVHTVGTARGILFCKTEGTHLNSLILPPVNVAKMINEDFVVKI